MKITGGKKAEQTREPREKKQREKLKKKKDKKNPRSVFTDKKKMDECNKRLERGGQNENAKQREPVSDRSEIASSQNNGQ